MGRLSSFARYLAMEGNVRVLFLQTLISQLGFGMFYVIWQPYVLSTGASVMQLGMIQSIINLSTAVGLISWGVLSDRFGRKPVILASNTCRVVALVALVVSGSYAFLLVFAFFMGFSSLFMQANPARSALISESVVGHKRATAFSTILAISQITNTLTSSAGGYLAITTGYLPIFYICILGDSAGLILLFAYLEETLIDRARITDQADGVLGTVTRYLLPEKSILRLYLIMTFVGLGYGTGYSLFYGTLVDTYGTTPLQLGLLSTAYSLTWGISSVPFGRLSDRLGRPPLLKASWTMGLTTALGFLLFRSFEAFLLFNVVMALDASLWLSAWMAYVAETASSERLSTVMGKLDSYARLVSIPAPWLASLLYSSHGFSAPLLGQVACLAVSGGFVFTLQTGKCSGAGTGHESLE